MNDVYWHPVLRASKLRKKPQGVTVQGEKLAVFRTSNGVAAIADRCPHRSASLSGGRVTGDNIECPYHGWRFNAEGRCTHIPLADEARNAHKTRAWAAREAHGLIFVTRNATAAGDIRAPMWDDQPHVSRIVESHAHATLVDAVENVLDPVHTLFVHKGIIRGGQGATSQVTLEAGIEAGELVQRYSGETQSNGLLSRLLERKRSHAISRFYRPGVVSLEYWGEQGLNLVTTLYFTQEDDTHLRGFAIITGPRQGGFGWLKAPLFVPLMRIVIAQDLKIMANATSNWEAAGRPPHAKGPLDILYPLITRVIEGETGDLPTQKITLDL